MKKSFFPIFLLSLSLMLVSWCFGAKKENATDQNTAPTTAPTQVKATWVSVCDNYLSVLKCMLDQPKTDNSLQLSQQSYDSLVQSFTNIAEPQLVETCTTLSNSLRANPKLAQDYPDCNML